MFVEEVRYSIIAMRGERPKYLCFNGDTTRQQQTP